MVRTLLAKGEVPKQLWPEAVLWAVHVLNRSPTFSVKNMTPQKAWNGRKPSVEHFKVFGCRAYTHIPDERRKKMDNKSEICVFLGVSDVSKAYSWSTNKTIMQQIQVDDVFDGENTMAQVSPQIEDIPQQFEEDIYNLRGEGSRKKLAWMMDYDTSYTSSDDDNAHFALFVDSGPITVEEASNEVKWKDAMKSEIRSIEKNNTW
ncbi:hypothetical protein ACFXTI_044151 [Malus domestica]